MRRFLTILVVASGAWAGCAPYPEARALRPAEFDTTELVAYRPLSRDDFRSPSATGFFQGDEEKIAASICVKIVVRPHDVLTRATEGGFVASLDDPIFFSVMSRKCSWWKADESLPDEQVLEHEQIHFAIAELEARRLNARVSDVVRQIYSAGTELGSVSQRAQGELRSILTAAEQASHERSKVFDLQVARDRVRQRTWLHKIAAELEATQAYARGPQASPLSAIALEPAPPPPAPAPAAAPPPAPKTPEPASSPSSTGSFPD